MTWKASNFVTELALKFPLLVEILEEHRADNFGEILPHLIMADYCRKVCAADSKDIWVVNFLEVLESKFSNDTDDDVSNVIAVSFIENLPKPNDSAQIVSDLPEKLRSQYEKFFGTT